MDPTLRKLSTKFVISATMLSSLASKEASSWSRVAAALLRFAEAELNEVAEAGVPSEDGEVMEESRSNAAGTKDCKRVAETPSVVLIGTDCAVR
jgi:branched-subunit amino acid aminotransferase/4-amino-4-deoxychorismate lyase